MNKNWFRVNLGDAMLSGQHMDDLEQLFKLEYTKAGSPNDMALFFRHESKGRLHCELVAYFSPACELIGEQVGASLCNAPVPNDLSLKIGSEESWGLLFPNFERNQNS